MQYGSSYLNLPQNGSLPRGGGPGWGQGYKFQKTYAFAWFGKRSNGNRPCHSPTKNPPDGGFFLASGEKSEHRGVSGLWVGLVDRLDVDGDAAVLWVVLGAGVLFAVTLDDETLRVDALLREVLRDGLGAAL